MKTIEELATDYCVTLSPSDPNFDFGTLRDEYDAFIAGINRAQQWIPINDKTETLEIGMDVIVKDKFGNIHIYRNIDDSFITIIKVCYKEWKPIEYK